jgi:2-methylisocitrate lyase-like PEP mutase family enzyme
MHDPEKTMSNAVETFRQLHDNLVPLRLPNAWDAGSARLIESQGATAIATTSAGLAWALGYPDGRLLPMAELVATVSRMVRIVKVPLSVDVENGYSDDPRVVAGNVMRLVDLGVAGINIEDGPDSSMLLASKIDAIRSAVSKAGTDLFVNARSDVFLRSLVEKSRLVEESITRSALYGGAGADGLFLPGIYQADHISAITSSVSLPLNVMAWPELADADALGKLGVRRLSAGSGISQVVLGTAEKLAQEFLRSGSSAPVYKNSISYSQLQELFG